jgi:hypothetical protein
MTPAAPSSGSPATRAGKVGKEARYLRAAFRFRPPAASAHQVPGWAFASASVIDFAPPWEENPPSTGMSWPLR